MAISINFLSPVKNQDAVPISSNIHIELVSDDAALDVYSTVLLINGEEVVPSFYYGIDQNHVTVNFYSRRKIKYKTRKYGQANFRYGQEDIFPSIFQYGSRYVCTIKIKDISGNLFEEHFAFNTETGVFYNPTVYSYYYSDTQALADYLPEWARGRYDKFSNFQQLINPSSKYLNEINRALSVQPLNYFVQSSNLNELATLYKVELSSGYKFQEIVLDDGTRLQVPPDITALKDITKFYPLPGFNNDIKEFFYKKLPDRLDEEKINISSLTIHPRTLIQGLPLALDKTLVIPGFFYITIDGGTKFVELKNKDFSILTCRIKGYSSEGKEQIEDLTIFDNDNYPTIKSWSFISEISFVNLPSNEEIYFTLSYFREKNSFIADSLFKFTDLEGNTKSTFWKMGENSIGSTLQLYNILKNTVAEIISTLAKKDLLMEYQLLDVDNVTPLNLIDVEVNPFLNYVFGIDNNYLYLFDKQEEYPSVLKLLPAKNGSANLVIDLTTDNFALEDGEKVIEFSGIQKYIDTEIIEYRFKITRPDGITEYILPDGTLTLDKNAAIVKADRSNIQLRTKIIQYTLNQLGDYILFLESNLKNGQSHVDAKIIRVLKKSALVKYKIDRLFSGSTIQGIYLDSDQQLRIYDSNQELHTIYLVKDNVLIDYGSGILYFNEAYDKIEVA